MNLKRQGELARAFLMSEIRRHGIRINNGSLQDLINEAKNLNAMGLEPQATTEEVIEFYVIFAKEAFADFEKRALKELETPVKK